jgi:hypothetical protein
MRKLNKPGDNFRLETTARTVARILDQSGLDGICILSTRAKIDAKVYSASFMVAEDDHRALTMLDAVTEFVTTHAGGEYKTTQIFGNASDEQN